VTEAGKVLVGVGVAVVVLGLIALGLGKLGFRGMPGDIRMETDNVRVYFPIVTCIVLSVLLSAALWLWKVLTRR
jgi:hypothetical protein